MRFALPLLVSSAAMAATITVSTPDNATFSNLPVSATATFIVGDGQLTVILTNLEANPTSVAQNLSDFGFSFADPSAPNAPFTSGTLASSSGIERTVALNGSYQDGSVVPTGWLLSTNQQFDFGAGLLIDLLGSGTPTHTIIGPAGGGGDYSNANGSIAGNKAHNPFLSGPVSFDVTIPGLHADSVLLGAEFSFGTTAGLTVDGIRSVARVPEPGPLGLAGLALIFGIGFRRHWATRG